MCIATHLNLLEEKYRQSSRPSLQDCFKMIWQCQVTLTSPRISNRLPRNLMIRSNSKWQAYSHHLTESCIKITNMSKKWTRNISICKRQRQAQQTKCSTTQGTQWIEYLPIYQKKKLACQAKALRLNKLAAKSSTWLTTQLSQPTSAVKCRPTTLQQIPLKNKSRCSTPSKSTRKTTSTSARSTKHSSSLRITEYRTLKASSKRMSTRTPPWTIWSRVWEAGSSISQGVSSLKRLTNNISMISKCQ